MSDLVAFLAARLDARELLAARLQSLREKLDDPYRVIDPAIRDGAEFIWRETLADPARVRREVAAGRAILELHGRAHECSVYSHGDVDPGAWCERPEDCSTLRAAVAVDSGHPGYDPAWKPAL